MATTDPSKLLEQLCLNAHPRKEASLRLIYRLCEEQHARSSRDFSIATIGRLSHEAGGPSAPAMRNKTGDDYKALMKVFASSVGGKPKKNADRKPGVSDELLEGVSDPVLRARIGILVAELASARGQLVALRHLANTTTVLRLDGSSEVTPDGHSEPDSRGHLSTQEKMALKRAISPDTLAHWGWSSEANGRVKTDAGQVVYPAGYLTAIRKVLEAS
ncbi:gamma-mobile-trio protein GmtX [Pseudomonas umsongensis]|uniref:gamma-mobile-trio protein GmtX n=1 Tax=Pseudomonas umsongensis TaxID=198618 RepID=UPI00200A4CB6|nr:gamma-mobile-trio protein GmtX [Pseudomonas umsongensis]MCK8687746.1 gamma-mobile-trio protein GmtX [Pseudomonas umsongensis]